MYASFSLQDVLNHRAVIVFPYPSSTMMLTELYRANGPMLAPSKQLLQLWDLDHSFLFERICGHPYVVPEARERSIPHNERPDSNSTDVEALDHWISLFDIYSWPHVLLFDSWEELAALMLSTDFRCIHESMVEHNAVEEQRIIRLWREVIHGMEMPKPATAVIAQPQLGINAQMQRQYDGKQVWKVNENGCINVDRPNAADSIDT